MTGYLLDTNVVSILAPASLGKHPELAEWLKRRAEELYLPSIAIAELSSGVARLRRLGATRKAEVLDLWLMAVLETFAQRIVALDADGARETGVLLDRALGRGLQPGFPDLAIGGIANTRGMVLLTRNLRHFFPLGIAAIDPFVTQPP